MRHVSVNVNGTQHELDVEDRRLLADLLREDLGLTGTKLGCSHGVCGSCTVQVDGRAVRSCLMLAAQADGRQVRTVEGLAAADELHPLQEAFREEHGLQCGFCTPGFLMTAAQLVESGAEIDEARARDLVSGNLCRCTGYDGIVKAVTAAAKAMRETGRAEVAQ